MKILKQLAVLLMVGTSLPSQGQTIPDKGNTNQVSQQDRLYGLSQIWSEAKYNFVYFDKLSIDWDSLYRATIPKVISAAGDLEYYNVLRNFAAQLHDGHTGVWYPMSYYNSLAQYAPLKTSLIDGKVFITGLLNDTLATQGLEKGMQILKINDKDVFDYANTYVSPYEGTSTPQGQHMMVYSTYLLNGPVDEPIKLTIMNKSGKTGEYLVSRKLTRKKNPAVAYRQTAEGTGILSINSFDNQDFYKIFDSLYTSILTTKGLIIDLRENGGGDGSQGLHILKHLTKNAFTGTYNTYRQYNPSFRSWGVQNATYLQFGPDIHKPFTDRTIYEKPVVVLIGKQTYSAAEDFTVLFDAMKRGVIIGQPSGGSTGQPLFIKLPGGGTFRVCIKKDTYPDGKEFVGVGIQPNIFVPESADSFVKGEDVELNKALEYLKAK
ncbi:S41 family peptidase [Flavihumibacter stibioxidans]|uniref:Tail specific protease domain-containing protein n=1 Tax=Flavihumibacter stibioxidans TaxID=1834163 RepID=A0ABR7MDC8_9BACT|nr:S41 family peptidase [Flavihumibacter stibioxidans]MBC6493035.1 hypothetical protein [Flavihumibacter stibioxidans]